MNKNFTAIAHTADLQLKITGNSQADLFRNAMVGMFQTVRPYSPNCKYEDDLMVCSSFNREHKISLTSPDIEILLVDFLSEALYLSDAYGQAYLDADIHNISPTSIDVTIKGVDIERFEVVEIKAVTFHDLSVVEKNGTWTANVVFDI